MKNKRNIFLFLIWAISFANATPTHYRYISKENFSVKPRHTTTWTLNYPNPIGSLVTFLPDLSHIFKNPPSFQYPNNFYHPPGYPFHHFPNFEHHSHFPNHEIHQKPEVTNFRPESQIPQEGNKIQPPNVEVESSTVKEVFSNQKPNIPQEMQSNDNAILIESLNKALDKLNSLLPSKDNKNTSPENVSTQGPSVVEPEILADSLNKAIDMLSEILAMQPPNSQNDAATTSPFFMENPTIPMINSQQMTLSLEEAIKELEKLFNRLPDELKNPASNQKPNNPAIFGIGQFHPIFVPRPIVSDGIPISKPLPEVTSTAPEMLYTSSPKNKDKQSTTTESSNLFTSSNNMLFTSSKKDKNQNKDMQNTTPMSSESNEFGSSESFGSSEESFGSSEFSQPFGSSESLESFESTESSEEATSLFTSAPKHKNKTETVTTPSSLNSEDVLLTSSESSEEANGLFTSAPKHKNKTETDTTPSSLDSEDVLFTSSPKDMLFTSLPKDKLFTSLPKIPSQTGNRNLGTEMTTTSEIIETTTKIIDTTDRIKEDGDPTTTEAFTLDVRFGKEPRSEDSIVFPDEFDEARTPDRISPSFIHENELNLASRFGESQTKPSDVNVANSNIDNNNSNGLPVQNMQPSNQITLEYVPQRPSFQPEPLVYPMPVIPHGEPLPGSSTEKNNYQQLGDRNSVPPTTTQRIVTSNPNTNTPISLEYKPSRPPFAPNPVVYPMPIIPSGEPLPGSSTERNNQQQLGDRNNVPSTSTQRIVTSKPNQNTPISLEYKPMRPFFAPDPNLVYPRPIIPPGEPLPGSSTERNNQQQLGDRNEVPSTTTQRIVDENTPISLEYKPSRPPFAPNPVIYPMPANFQELGDRNQITTSTTPRPTIRTTTTRRPYYTNTPIVLGYKPSRPPYVPEPWIYPSPGLIPPGTPWPASSTERPLGK